MQYIIGCLLSCLIVNSDGYKILGIFPYNGKSHHIYFSSLVEELVSRGHEVTVINYHPLKKNPNLRQIFLDDQENTSSDRIDIDDYLKGTSSDIISAYGTAQIFKYMANINCKKMTENNEIQEIINTKQSFDVILVEQFITDCSLGIAYKLNAPTIGITAHILMPWTYSRLGAPNNAAYVHNHFFGSGTTPTTLNRIKSAIINGGMNMFYKYVIQKSDKQIVNELYPDVPDLEAIAKNMSLIFLNQYFSLTGPRLYGPNVIEIGGMHIKDGGQVLDKELQRFLDTSEIGVVYISFGTVAANFPRAVVDEIKKLITNTNTKFIWKTEITDWSPSSNVFIRKWMPQVPILCHPKVVAFVTHSGMLSSSEAMHCGVPIISMPLFGDQFANSALAVERGLGVAVDITRLTKDVLDRALKTVLQDKYQKRAKKLSQLWRDRPLSPMETAIYWTEYVARHKENVDLKPPTVDLPFNEVFMFDVLFVFSLVFIICLVIWSVLKVLLLLRNQFIRLIKQSCKKEKKN